MPGSSVPTVFHVLNGCPVALTQSRYTWRHGSVLARFDGAIRSNLSVGEQLFSDLPGSRAHDNPQATVPHDLVITSARPDMVYIKGNTVTLVELTIPANSLDHLRSAKTRKSHKPLYQTLLSDLDSLGKKASLITIEIGSLGHSLPSCCKEFLKSFPVFDKSSVRQLLTTQPKLPSLPLMSSFWLGILIIGLQTNPYLIRS